MAMAFVLGNGVSRQAVDLIKLKQHGSIYGCNALYREFVPDVLVSTDRPIAQRIQESGYSLRNRFYTRRPISGSGAQAVPKKYHGNSSGPIACVLAAMDSNTKVYMLGFDMGPDQQQKFNNVYAGTEFYKPQGALPTFTGNWIKQIKQIAQDFSQVEFVRVCGKTTADIPEFKTNSNIVHMPIDDFLLKFN
jgi:hypothetical protein